MPRPGGRARSHAGKSVEGRSHHLIHPFPCIEEGDEQREAAAKLRRLFRRVGFERIRGTRFHGLSC